MRERIRTITWLLAFIVTAGLLTVGPASAWSPQAKSKAKQQPKQGQADQKPGDQKPADQQQTDQQQPPPPAPKGVLTQKVTLRSSRQTKDVASAGFNGVGPDGKVKEALLNANPSADARAKAARLTLLEADASEVQAFAKEGKLATPPAKSADKKGK
jgi:hypothetical protein